MCAWITVDLASFHIGNRFDTISPFKVSRTHSSSSSLTCNFIIINCSVLSERVSLPSLKSHRSLNMYSVQCGEW